MNSKQSAILFLAGLAFIVLASVALFVIYARSSPDYSRTTYGESKTVVVGGSIYDASHKTNIDGLLYAITPESLGGITFASVITDRDGWKAALMETNDSLIPLESGETYSLPRTIFRDTPQERNEVMLRRVLVNITFLGTSIENHEGYFQVEVVPVPQEPQVRF